MGDHAGTELEEDLRIAAPLVPCSTPHEMPPPYIVLSWPHPRTLVVREDVTAPAVAVHCTKQPCGISVCTAYHSAALNPSYSRLQERWSCLSVIIIQF